jgi:very-short-patch-repair endonuclease
MNTDGNCFGIITGQHVTDEKRLRSRELRREMTPAERRLWEALRGGRLGGLRFRRQQVIDGFIIDFYCHVARLVVEVDGGIHEDQQGHDEARDHILAGRGIRVMRCSNEDVLGNLDHALRQITLAVGMHPPQFQRMDPPVAKRNG